MTSRKPYIFHGGKDSAALPAAATKNAWQRVRRRPQKNAVRLFFPPKKSTAWPGWQVYRLGFIPHRRLPGACPVARLPARSALR